MDVEAPEGLQFLLATTSSRNVIGQRSTNTHNAISKSINKFELTLF